MFAVHRWKGVGRLLLLAAALVLLGYGVAGYQQGAEALWLTVVLPGLLLLGAAPFFGPMPRANP